MSVLMSALFCVCLYLDLRLLSLSAVMSHVSKLTFSDAITALS